MIVLGLGDSILLQTNHVIKAYFAKRAISYDALRNEENNAHWHNQGDVNVGLTENLVRVLKVIKDQGQFYDGLIVHLGLHDIKISYQTMRCLTSPESYEQILTSLFKEVKTVAKHIFWVTIPTILDDVHNHHHHVGFKRFDQDAIQYNNIMKRLATQFGINVIDTHRSHKLCPSNLSDHVHLNQTSEHTYAEFIAEEVMTVLAKEIQTS